MPNLVGIGLSQVPTNSMLGGMAYQDPEHASIKDLDLKNLSQINSEIADTAVDVFVYDTSKDSDGGAWRKRTTHTSWYNETLGTATRGTRREFPSVAVIVTETRKVTIYDGDDPDLPMWMIFNAGSGNALYYPNSSNGTSTVMLNGKLANAATGGSPRFRTIDFLSDSHLEYSHTDGRTTFNINVSQRNAGLATFNYGNVSGAGLINRDCNDVAMTVLPNAPIDDATGLPVPTIAVATNGGLSVIKDDGSIVDWIETSGPDSVHKVNFRKDNRLGVFTSGTSGATGYPQLYYIDIPSSDISSGYYYDFSGNSIERYGGTAWETNSDRNLVMKSPSTSPTAHNLTDMADTPNLTYSATNGGLNAIIRPESLNGSTGRFDMRTAAIAYIQNDYNTGYMHGDIKGAFLSDTDATNVIDSNVVNNGTFDSNTSGWSGDSGAAISWDSGGFASVGNGGGDNTYAIAQSGILVSGAKYRVTGRVQPSMSGSYEFRVRAGGASTQWNMTSGLTNGQWYSFDTGIITADGTVLEIGSLGGTITNFYLDDVYVWKLEEEDRSVNNTGLEVHGTITKSAVATGADLVGYSPSSNTSYLEQPYNSALDYGTGDMYYSVWVYANSSDSFSGNTYIFERSSISDTSNRRIEARMTTPTKVEIYACNNVLDNNVPVPANVWYKLDILRRSGEAFVYINGEYHSSTTGAAATGSLSDSSAKLVIGNRAYFATRQYGFPSNSKIALFRTGAGAPSAEQVKKMYNDEKHLFEENAKATLYGSSDVVTALDYDEVTEQLHVGTSSGRSDFQGLRRINNTTTAVTTAISAHDEFIVEQ